MMINPAGATGGTSQPRRGVTVGCSLSAGALVSAQGMYETALNAPIAMGTIALADSLAGGSDLNLSREHEAYLAGLLGDRRVRAKYEPFLTAWHLALMHAGTPLDFADTASHRRGEFEVAGTRYPASFVTERDSTDRRKALLAHQRPHAVRTLDDNSHRFDPDCPLCCDVQYGLRLLAGSPGGRPTILARELWWDVTVLSIQRLTARS